MKKFHILLALLGLLSFCSAFAQGKPDAPAWYFGVNGGYRATFPSFSEIDTEFYPKKTTKQNGVFAIFVQREFGANRNYGIRPELVFLSRGGGIKNIGINNVSYLQNGIEDVFYTVSSRYVDIRVPLIYNVGNANSIIRPYAYIAPVLGFATGGKARLESDYTDSYFDGVDVALNKANYNSVYFAGAVALGARYHFPLGESKAFLGLEMMYECGFTDTYGSKEKKGEAINVNPMFPAHGVTEGSRKYQGFELKLTLGIPFDVFKKTETQTTLVYVREPVVNDYKPVPVPDKACYSLDEIVDLMSRGEDVYGKTICAIDEDINFEFGKSSISPASYAYLKRLAQTLIRTNAHIIVKGHTDNIGSEESNLLLSKNRAENVVRFLLKQGVPASRLSMEYYGMSRPIDTNETEAGRAQNRRVEFEINRNIN